jgi:hypothetical protein
MPEESHKLTALVMMTATSTLAPHFDRTTEKHHPASGAFGVVRVEFVKDTSNRGEWEKSGVVIAHQVVDGGVNMTVGKHDLDNVDGGKSLARLPTPGEWDVSQHFRRHRRRNLTRFIE